MKQVLVCSALALVAASVGAQEAGRVLSSTPVVQQVAVPRQVCQNTQVAVGQPRTGAGALMGAVAGGAVGNAVGGGSGRAVATVLGVLGGAMLGDSIEGGPPQLQNVPQCHTQTVYENRAVAYNVVYEYAGRQYSLQMPNDPGPTIALQVSPAGASAAAPQAPYPAEGTVGAPVYAAPHPVYAPVPVYATPSPYYYGRPYAPVGVSLNFGFYGGHRHWR